MKTSLLLIGFAITVSAQNHPFVFRSEIKTNPPQHVAASGVTLAHDVITVVEIAYVATVDAQGIKPFDQQAVRIVSQTTNIVAATQVQKPLLSAQRPPPKAAPAPVVKPPKTPPTLSGADTLELKTKIPATHVPSPPPSNSMAYVNWAMRNNVTNALPPNASTNSPIYRRFSEWKKNLK